MQIKQKGGGVEDLHQKYRYIDTDDNRRKS